MPVILRLLQSPTSISLIKLRADYICFSIAGCSSFCTPGCAQGNVCEIFFDDRTMIFFVPKKRNTAGHEKWKIPHEASFLENWLHKWRLKRCELSMYKGATTLKDVVFALMTLIPIDHFSFFKKISFNFEPSQDKRMESFFFLIKLC